MIEKHDKYFNFVGQIETDKTNPLIDFINSHDGSIFIGMKSTGGSLHLQRFLTKVLNEQKSRISLCATELIYSSAFELFMSFEGQQYITHGTVGMTHYSSVLLNITESGQTDSNEDTCFRRNLKLMKPHSLEVVQKYMTKTEIEKYKKSWQVYFDFNRMKEIFPSAIILP